MLAAAGTFAMVVNLSGDVSGFIIPVVVLVWPLAAVGLDAVHGAVRTPSFARLMALLTGLIGVALGAAIPIRNLLTNYLAVDQRGQTADAEFVRAAYQQLPDRAAVVADGYARDMTLMYLAVTGESGRTSELESIPGPEATRCARRFERGGARSRSIRLRRTWPPTVSTSSGHRFPDRPSTTGCAACPVER